MTEIRAQVFRESSHFDQFVITADKKQIVTSELYSTMSTFCQKWPKAIIELMTLCSMSSHQNWVVYFEMTVIKLHVQNSPAFSRII